mgnify:CR=1 FL=1
MVLTTVPSKYCFAVAVALAVFPLLLADLLVIFQAVTLDCAVTVDEVHLDVPLPYVKVPVTLTYHYIRCHKIY